MTVPKTISELQQLIDHGVEENIQLDYKSGDALQNTDPKKKEIAKDVSAMANAAGGIIIYGIKEFDTPEKRHLPDRFMPVSRTAISKEWLEQVINANISPKVDGLLIHPVPLQDQEHVIYVVEIPQSNTAHQNTKDMKYYRRYNFESVAMLDYEIRDIMNRLKHPVMEMSFEIEKYTYEVKPDPMARFSSTQQFHSDPLKFRTDYRLRVFPVNAGNVYAQYINYFIQLPEDILDIEESAYLKKVENNYVEYYGENTHRDIVDVKVFPFGNVNKYGPSRFDPVLPSLKGRSEKLKLRTAPVFDEREISWAVYADNATPKTGKIRLDQIKIVETDESE